MATTGDRKAASADALRDLLESLPSKAMHLDDDAEENPHRPCVRVSASLEDRGPCVVVSLAAMFGQPLRFIEMTPAEAHALARHLIMKAEAVLRSAASVAEHQS